MGQKFSSLCRVMEAANHSKNSAMDAENHVKHRAYLKSLMSRGILFIGIAICVGLSACSPSSSPEKDGIKAAKKICDCRDDMPEVVIKATESYIKNFNFKSRVEAREKLNEMQQKVQTDYQDCINNANAYRDELKSKYITNQENVGKFDYAYNAQVNAFVPKPPPSRYEGVDFQSQIESMIKAIIPPKPDFNLERLRKDMIATGVVYHTTNGVFTYSYIRNNIQELKILNTTDKGDEIIVLVYLELNSNAGFMHFSRGNVNVTYTLGDRDDYYIKGIREAE